eukprot:TRINITY_DN3252_c0_g4_i2.p1 TRINITY_DN3252_c0_g4~~TRINITY_DN3252_c0_g4_i2.p1  ORF type:complete len:283 (-),score=44.72 TRINITY_DN3252_c0_g4_i2:121-969(-)
MKFVHLHCLKSWIQQKVSVKRSSDMTIIKLRSLSCELCKTPYPFAINFNGQIFELIDCVQPIPPYVVFEHRAEEMDIVLFILSFAKSKKLTIGRDNNYCFALKDTSVSRKHAVFSLENDGVYLKDAGSKFGTLVLMQRPYALKPNQAFYVQCGNSLLELSVEAPCAPLPSPKVNSKKSLAGIASCLPEECLPGYGKHQLLVVRKLMYDQLPKEEESLKRAKTPEGRNGTGVHSTGLNRSSSSVFKLSRTTLRTTGPVKFNRSVFIIKHVGDFADDIDDKDCQ